MCAYFFTDVFSAYFCIFKINYIGDHTMRVTFIFFFLSLCFSSGFKIGYYQSNDSNTLDLEHSRLTISYIF